MSETTPNSTNDACEQLLDYVYGELDDARKRAFEEHLAGCARCQTEAASFGRVRAAVKRVMPAVEPSGNVACALHAQLMHAAAQRKPRRGVLLAFPRKVMQHPAWAMAAMFTIVGGAIAINWSRGKMALPAAETAQPVASAPAVAAEPAMPEATLEKKKAKEHTTADAPKPTEDYKSGGKGGEFAKLKDEETSGDSVKLDAAEAGKLTVQRPAPHRAAATPVVAKEAAPKTKKVSANNGANFDDLVAADGLAGQDKAGAGQMGGVLGATSGAGAASRGAPAGAASAGGRLDSEGASGTKSSAPNSLSRSGKAELQQANTRDNRGYATSAQQPQKQRFEQSNAPAQAPPPPPAATVPAAPSPVTSSTVTERDVQPQSQGYYRNKSSVQSPAGPTRETESLRKKADEAAKANRCDEALKMYQELDKLSQYITPTERLNYVRCLNQKGRQEEALKRLDELKNDKRITNSELQKVENEISDSRRRQEPRAEKKAPAKKPAAAPADRAAEKQQQRAADSAPAEAAPPPATTTDTKTQKAY